MPKPTRCVKKNVPVSVQSDEDFLFHPPLPLSSGNTNAKLRGPKTTFRWGNRYLSQDYNNNVMVTTWGGIHHTRVANRAGRRK